MAERTAKYTVPPQAWQPSPSLSINSSVTRFVTDTDRPFDESEEAPSVTTETMIFESGHVLIESSQSSEAQKFSIEPSIIRALNRNGFHPTSWEIIDTTQQYMRGGQGGFTYGLAYQFQSIIGPIIITNINPAKFPENLSHAEDFFSDINPTITVTPLPIIQFKNSSRNLLVPVGYKIRAILDENLCTAFVDDLDIPDPERLYLAGSPTSLTAQAAMLTSKATAP